MNRSTPSTLHWVSSSLSLSKDHCIRKLVGEPVAPRLQSIKHLARLTAQYPQLVVIGWGFKPTTHKARHWAERLRIPFYQLEEGFISYLGHPALRDKRFSLVLDTHGIYYDARQPSALDATLDNIRLSEQQKQRTRQLLTALLTHNISKYNHRPVCSKARLAEIKQRYITKPRTPLVLLIDQTEGDASISGALATNKSFEQLLKRAVADNPKATLLLKAHPDVLLGKKRGYLFEQLEHYPQIKIMAEDLPPTQLLSLCDKVYTISSQLGFEALWQQHMGRRVEVHCFGLPFYAGRGLTIDYQPPLHRRRPCDIYTLCYASLLVYTRYIDPETGQNCELEDLLPLLAEQTRERPQFREIHATGFSFWKRLFLPDWLKPITRQYRFHRSLPAYPINKHDALLLWGNQHEKARASNIIRVEDGFIRSQGLGIDLHPPLSLIFDDTGIYFDATRPSALENLLQNADLSEAQQHRAAALIEQIQKHNISKYNLGQPALDKTQLQFGDKPVILVAGQVDTDASIAFGTGDDFSSVQQMLETVRRDRPDTFIIYRPHPDVVTGERQGLTAEQAQPWADYIDTNSDINSTLALADEVHVLSSLTGFEALLRGKKVVCYGLPFYAGWGLTEDKTQCPRRNRQRTLNELVYLSLLQYPRYLHPVTRRYTTAERIVAYLFHNKALTITTGRHYIARFFQKCRLLAQQLKLHLTN